MTKDTGSQTQYGFQWGPADVSRSTAFEHRPGEGLSRSLRVSTPYADLNIYISPTGRSVRVFRAGKELR